MKKLILLTTIVLIIFSGITSAQNNSSVNQVIYEPVEGKVVGIWPHENKLRSTEKLNELKDKYGFNYILVAAPYGEEWLQYVRKSNYDFDHIVKQLHYGDLMKRPDWFWNNIEITGKVWAYYFDEPMSREFSYIGVLKLLTQLAEKGFYPHAQFIFSELDEKKAIQFSSISDILMYSGYGSREKKGEDQVESWKTWREYLGPKLSQVWISSLEDSLEYRTLLKAAKDLEMNGVWLYQYEPLEAEGETSDANLQKFCEAAAEFGFLRLKK